MLSTHVVAALLENVEATALRDGIWLLAADHAEGAKDKFELSFSASVQAARYVASRDPDWPTAVSCYGGEDAYLPGKLSVLEPVIFPSTEDTNDNGCVAANVSNQRLSALFTDAATAKWNWMKLTENGGADIDRHELLTAGVFGVQLAEQPGTRANSFAVLGEAFAAWGDDAKARAAFASAYEGGIRADWLESQWRSVGDERPIAAYPTMEFDDVADIYAMLRDD